MIKRVGSVIGLPKEYYEEYKRYHAKVWPEILDVIEQCKIRNFSIYYKDEMLFSYYEYYGDDFENDVYKWQNAPVCKEWNEIMVDFQRPFETRMDGEWWAEMEEIFHT